MPGQRRGIVLPLRGSQAQLQHKHSPSRQAGYFVLFLKKVLFPSVVDISLPQAPLSWLTPGAVSPGLGQGPLLSQHMGLTTKILYMNTEKRKASPSFCKDFPRTVIPHRSLCHVMPCFLTRGCEFGRKEKLYVLITQRYQGKPYCCVQNRDVKGFAAKISALPSPFCSRRSSKVAWVPWRKD